jgi:hypothetical protein
LWLKKTIFLGKEKGKRKKGNKYKVAFQQIQVQQYGITISNPPQHILHPPFAPSPFLPFALS